MATGMKALDPAPIVKVGEIELLVTEAGRTADGLTGTVLVRNGRPVTARVMRLADMADHATLRTEIETKTGQDASAFETPLLELLALAEAELRRQHGKSERKDGNRDEEPRRQQSLTPPGMVCAAVSDDGARMFVLRNDDGTLHIVPSVVGDFRGETVTHVPPATLPWPLPRAHEIVRHYGASPHTGRAAELLRKIEDWLRKASDLGNDSAYLLLALHVFAGYVIEQLDYLAIIELIADAERGKSRTGHAWACVSRHGMALVGIREATVLRAATDKLAALFIDLTDLWETAKRAGCDDILLARWERGGYVERVKYPDRGAFEDIVTYFVFGPTLLASNRRTNNVMETRVCGIDMPLTKRRFAGRIRPEDALPLFEELMAWRADMLGQPLVACDPPTDGRLGDILLPLKRILLTVAPERAEEFDALVTWQRNRRREDLSQTTEAAILRAIKACGSRVQHASNVSHIKLAVILEQFNNKQPADAPSTVKWLGVRVRAMSFETRRIDRDRKASLIWDADLLERLCDRYGITDEDEQAEQSDEQGNNDAPHAPDAPQASAEPAANQAPLSFDVEVVERVERVEDCKQATERHNAGGSEEYEYVF